MTYPDDAGVETPAEDAAEQATNAFPDWIDDQAGADSRPLDTETPEWDAQEQSQIVQFDDDYR
jgi:hypothetical protein